MARVKEALMDACETVINEVNASDAELQADYDADELAMDIIFNFYGNIPACVLPVAKANAMLAAYIPADAQHDD